jgi:hypothetical protein
LTTTKELANVICGDHLLHRGREPIEQLVPIKDISRTLCRDPNTRDNHADARENSKKVTGMTVALIRRLLQYEEYKGGGNGYAGPKTIHSVAIAASFQPAVFQDVSDVSSKSYRV